MCYTDFEAKNCPMRKEHYMNEELNEKIKSSFNTIADKAKAAFETAVDFGAKHLGEAVEYADKQGKIAALIIDIKALELAMGKEFLNLGKEIYVEYSKKTPRLMKTPNVVAILEKIDGIKAKIETLEKQKETIKEQK